MRQAELHSIRAGATAVELLRPPRTAWALSLRQIHYRIAWLGITTPTGDDA